MDGSDKTTASSANSIDCEAFYKQGAPIGSSLPVQIFDQCYRDTPREILIPQVNAEDPSQPPAAHSAQEALTKAYMEAKDAVLLIRASDGRHKPEAGSAFIIDKDGLAVTNHHVIADGRTQIVLSDDSGVQHGATLVLDDPEQDLALLKIDKTSPAETFPAIQLGSSQNLKQSQTLLAIGHPLMQPEKFAAVSHYVGPIAASAIPRIRDFPGTGPWRITLETDALVWPGNSGGVLLDLNARAVGVNDLSNTVNKAYAMPIERVTELRKRRQESEKPDR